MSETLPSSVLSEGEDFIGAEDVILEIIRRRLPDLHTTSLIEQNETPPFVLFRQVDFSMEWGFDSRFMEEFWISAECFTDGLNADTDGPKVLHAITRALQRAALAHEIVLDGKAWVQEAHLIAPPRRRADWANSEGPVQYADLPHSYARYMAVYQVKIKKAIPGPNVYNF